MIVGVEGNVHVGKTYFIKNQLKHNEIDIKPEIEFKSELSKYDRQLFYIEQESLQRKKMLNDKNIILDRTIVSTYIYTLYSKEFTPLEIEKIVSLIRRYNDEKKFLIPKSIFYIIYPYDLICENHKILFRKKHTQNLLVDYNYYIKYNLFFQQILTKSRYIINSMKDFRQIILLENVDKMFNEILNSEIEIMPKVLLDGAPAIGKSTIGKKQSKYKYIGELKYKKYDLTDYSNQIDSIVERILLLSGNNIMADTSFLMGITHLFYNESATKKQKKEMIEKIIKKVPLNIYITKIIYLRLPMDLLYKRKQLDKSKERKHFEQNISYLEKEINFYDKINKKLHNKSNIHIIDANNNQKELIDTILNIEDKPLLLIDLFYCMTRLIEENEI